MSVRKRRWRDKQGRQHTRWMIHVEYTAPDGSKQTIRKVSPVQSKRGAEAFEREVRKQLFEGAWKESTKKQTPTLAAFAEEFLAFQATRNKPSELAHKQMVLKHHLLPVFGDTPLDQIDVRAVDAYKVAKLEHPGPRGHVLNPNTINKHIKLLARILRVAKRWKLITEVPELSKLKPRKVDFDFLGFDEAEQFIAGAREHVPQWHPFIVVAMRTGLRHGELAALRWREDLDLERGRIRVQRSYNPLNGFTSTKNEKVRELPLTWDALEALKTQRQRVDASCELVFPRPNGEVISANLTNGVLRKLAKALGLRHVHNHMLRHTFASHAAMRGVPLRQIQEWLGHGSIVVTQRYAHLAQGIGDDLILRLAPPHTSKSAASQQHTDDTQNSSSSKSDRQDPPSARS